MGKSKPQVRRLVHALYNRAVREVLRGRRPRSVAFNRKSVDIARSNVDLNFDLAESLANAKNLTDVVVLQAAFWRKQFGVLTAQAEEVRTLSANVTADMSKPSNRK